MNRREGHQTLRVRCQATEEADGRHPRSTSVLSPQSSVLRFRRVSVIRSSFFFFLAMAAAGCGYQFRVEGAGPTIGGAQATAASTPPPRLVIRTLENRSFEPNLETRLTNYVRQEFASGSGATVVPDSEAADLVLSGQILSVIIPTLSFTQTQTLESRTEVVVAIKVEETRTKRLVWTQMAKGASEFYVTQDLQFNRVLQNRALEQAGRYIAEDLASRFLLQLESGQLAKPAANVTPTATEKP